MNGEAEEDGGRGDGGGGGGSGFEREQGGPEGPHARQELAGHAQNKTRGAGPECGGGGDEQCQDLEVEEVMAVVGVEGGVDAAQRGGSSKEDGGGQVPHGPGAVMWHAAASVFDRFLVIYGGRRVPPSALRSAPPPPSSCSEERCQGAASSSRLSDHVHVFDTVARQWVASEIEGWSLAETEADCGPPPRFRHTLTRIGPVVSSAGGSSDKTQVLLVLGGMPSGSDAHVGGATGAGMAPFAIVCTLKQGHPCEDDERAGGCVLKLAFREVKIEDPSRSWIGALGRGEGICEEHEGTGRADRGYHGWIGHTACMDELGAVLVYGGTRCSWEGLLSPDQGRFSGQDLLRLRLGHSEEGSEALRLDVERLKLCGPGPGECFAHSSCVLEGQGGRGHLVVQGGVVLRKAAQLAEANGCGKGGRADGMTPSPFMYLLDLETRAWRRTPFPTAFAASIGEGRARLNLAMVREPRF